MKYPAVYVYKRTSDRGRELRYSLRSLVNVTNWNGEVFICGDKEAWLSDKVQMIPFGRSHIKYQDVRNKLKAISEDKRVPDDFLFFNDDFFVMRPTEVTPLYDGRLKHFDGASEWRRSKSKTRDYLIERGIKNPYNYAVHAPIPMNKQNLAELLSREDIQTGLSIRSLYGNIYKIGGRQYKDRKTLTRKLPRGEILSTRLYTTELHLRFPYPSEFENDH
jgi:hypothetical protein